jgi:hypothetical protein
VSVEAADITAADQEEVTDSADMAEAAAVQLTLHL